MHAFKLEKNRRKIFQSFLYAETFRFSEIAHKTKIASNLLAYFLTKMVKEEILIKEKGAYRLSSEGEKLIPFFVPNQQSISPLVVLLFFCHRGKELFLVTRQKRPYKGFWSLPSGRLLIGESLRAGAKRIMLEKYGLSIAVGEMRAVMYERLIEGDVTKHGFVFFVMDVTPVSENQTPFFGKWFSPLRVPKNKTIASDYWLIAHKRHSHAEVVEEEVSSRGKKMKIVTE